MSGPTSETPPQTARARRAPGFLSLWLPPVLYLAAIFVISSEPQPFIAPPAWIWESDKIAHFGAYAVLGALLCRAYLGSGLAGSAAFWLALLTASLYGASDEWHQSFVPNRSADPADWLADSIGAALGAALFLLVLRALDRRASMP
ncbi:MAG TPA: VanZ family protein [Anaeromyxobacteraceae bacterium]|nr:VanZ family protein [Anaeromyxobacteraceae bacterium]